MAKRNPTGGLSAGRHPSQFDPIQLEIGTRVEMEHTKSRKVARKIASQHLSEDRAYYYKLAEMEAGALGPVEPACGCAVKTNPTDFDDTPLTPGERTQQIKSMMKRYGLNKPEAERLVDLPVPVNRRILQEHYNWTLANGLPADSSPLSRGYLMALVDSAHTRRNPTPAKRPYSKPRVRALDNPHRKRPEPKRYFSGYTQEQQELLRKVDEAGPKGFYLGPGSPWISPASDLLEFGILSEDPKYGTLRWTEHYLVRATQRLPKSKLPKPGTVLLPRFFIQGYPTGISVDTRVVVKEVRQGRLLVVRDNGREGQWWVDPEAMRRVGENPDGSPPSPTLLEKGYVFQLTLLDGDGSDKEKAYQFKRFSHIMLHDPSGRQWPKCDVLMMKGQLKPQDSQVRRPTEAAKDYFGAVPIFQQSFKIPPKDYDGWKEVGQCVEIYYDRVGATEDPFHHPFDRSALPILYTATIDGKKFWRLSTGTGCEINERGYVWP